MTIKNLSAAFVNKIPLHCEEKNNSASIRDNFLILMLNTLICQFCKMCSPNDYFVKWAQFLTDKNWHEVSIFHWSLHTRLEGEGADLAVGIHRRSWPDVHLNYIQTYKHKLQSSNLMFHSCISKDIFDSGLFIVHSESCLILWHTPVCQKGEENRRWIVGGERKWAEEKINFLQVTPK